MSRFSNRKSALKVGVVVTIIYLLKERATIETTKPFTPLLLNALLKVLRIKKEENPGIRP
jgi:hypothetical protein